MDNIHDMKSTIVTKNLQDQPFRPPRSLIDEFFDIVGNMKLDSETTIDQIITYTH